MSKTKWPDGTPKSTNNAFTSAGFTRDYIRKMSRNVQNSMSSSANVDEYRKHGIDLSNLAFLSVNKIGHIRDAKKFVVKKGTDD